MSGLSPELSGLIEHARAGNAESAAAAWEVLSWCDGHVQGRLDNAIANVESKRRRIERQGRHANAVEALLSAEKWLSEVQGQAEACEGAGNRELEALALIEYAVAAGNKRGVDLAASKLMPRLSSAAKVRNAEQLLRIRTHLNEWFAKDQSLDVHELELLQAGLTTGMLARDPLRKLAVDYALWLNAGSVGSSPLDSEAVGAVGREDILQAGTKGEQLYMACCS